MSCLVEVTLGSFRSSEVEEPPSIVQSHHNYNNWHTALLTFNLSHHFKYLFCRKTMLRPPVFRFRCPDVLRSGVYILSHRVHRSLICYKSFLPRCFSCKNATKHFNIDVFVSCPGFYITCRYSYVYQTLFYVLGVYGQ